MSHSKKAIAILFGFLVSALYVTALEASLIVGTSATASSSYTSLGRTPTKAVNGDGLLGDSHNTNASDMWLTDASTFVAGTTWFKVNLGGTYNVGDMKVWNYNESGTATNRGIQLADIYVSPTGAGVPGTGDWVQVLNDQLFGKAPGTAGYNTPTVVALNQSTAFVGFVVVSNYNSPFVVGNDYAGLSEAQFFTAIPEPSAISIIVIGLFCSGRALRRHAKAKTREAT